MNDVVKAIEAAARKLAQTVVKDGVSAAEMTEAVKVLAPYYTALKKAEGKSDDDPSDGTTMSALQEALHEAEEVDHGGRTVSRHQRRRN